VTAAKVAPEPASTAATATFQRSKLRPLLLHNHQDCYNGQYSANSRMIAGTGKLEVGAGIAQNHAAMLEVYVT